MADKRNNSYLKISSLISRIYLKCLGGEECQIWWVKFSTTTKQHCQQCTSTVVTYHAELKVPPGNEWQSMPRWALSQGRKWLRLRVELLASLKAAPPLLSSSVSMWLWWLEHPEIMLWLLEICKGIRRKWENPLL